VERLAQRTTTDDGRVLMFAEYGPVDRVPAASRRGPHLAFRLLLDSLLGPGLVVAVGEVAVQVIVGQEARYLVPVLR
jgi:hypothetical protein